MNIKYLATIILFSISALSAHAWDLKDLLGKASEAMSQSQTSNTPSLDDIAGLFTKSNLEVKDLAGTWTVVASAVSFQGDNFLQQAGGAAAATIVENKLDPYYKKYGLLGATLTIDKDGKFTLQMKKLKLTGTVTVQKEEKDKPAQGGNFFFNFDTFGSNSLGSVNTYVTKSAKGLEVMFDATKLRAILNSIASFSKMQLAKTATDLLNSYDGICIGFELTPAGAK
ncbi:MAG: DUF4923 family protein [Prevotella sp.]|nr:DUF4923 family protein [Prevotella sp.]MCM1074824.1 DUF4923 family protein [Ruminococcus sp.]